MGGVVEIEIETDKIHPGTLPTVERDADNLESPGNAVQVKGRGRACRRQQDRGGGVGAL